VTENNRILQVAKAEVQEERFRAAVEAEKTRLRQHRPWWERLLPFVIRIERRK
jgi:hypothetical protein